MGEPDRLDADGWEPDGREFDGLKPAAIEPALLDFANLTTHLFNLGVVVVGGGDELLGPKQI